MRFFLFLLLGVFAVILITPSAYAETPQERVGITSGWFVMNYTNTLPETRYRSNNMVVGEWSFWSLELDPEIGLMMRPVNYTAIEVRVFNNPTRASYTSLEATLCVNSSVLVGIPGNIATPIKASSWCAGDAIYHFPLFPTNTNFKLQFREHPSFEIWLGNGQGGGGDGLEACERMEATLTNTSDINGSILLRTNWTGSWYYVGGAAGCTPQTEFFEYQNITSGAWLIIPQNNNSEPIDCNGLRCFNTTNASVGSIRTYNKTTRCDKTVTLNISTRLRYLKLGTPTDARSPIITLYCGTNPPSPPSTTITVPPVPRRKEYGWIILIAGIALVTLVTLPYSKSKLYPEPPQ